MNRPLILTIEDVVAHWKEAVREVESHRPRDFEAQIAYQIGQILPDIEDSPLDHAFYVFVVLKDQSPVHVGYCEGIGRKRAIIATQKRYQGNVALILAYGISQRQAKTMVQSIKRKLQKRMSHIF